MHLNPNMLLVHVAPFLQALSRQASYSYWQPIPANPSVQEQFRPEPKSLHFPPCMHGLPIHLSGAVSHCFPSVPGNNNKIFYFNLYSKIHISLTGWTHAEIILEQVDTFGVVLTGRRLTVTDVGFAVGSGPARLTDAFVASYLISARSCKKGKINFKNFRNFTQTTYGVYRDRKCETCKKVT